MNMIKCLSQNLVLKSALKKSNPLYNHSLARNKHAFIATLALAILLSQTHFASAISNSKSQNNLKKIVLIESKSSIGTGFIASIQNKMMVITILSVLDPDGSTKLLDIDGKEIKYKRLMFPKNQQCLIFFELDESEYDRMNFLEIETDTSSACPIDSKVFVYGFKTERKTATREKGKISGLGPSMVTVDIKNPKLTGGGPIIASSNNKVVAVLDGQKPKKASDPLYGLRLDTLSDLEEFNFEEFKDKYKTLKDVKNGIAKIYKKSQEITAKLEVIIENLEDEGTLQLQRSESLKKSIEKNINFLKKEIKSAVKLEHPFFKQEIDKQRKNAKEFLKYLKEKLEKLEKLIEENEPSRKKL